MLFARGVCGRSNIMARYHIARSHLIRIKIVDSNNTFRERFGVAQKISFLLRDDVPAYGVANPIDAVKSANQAAPRGSLDLVLNRLGLDHFFEGHLQQARWVEGIV